MASGNRQNPENAAMTAFLSISRTKDGKVGVFLRDTIKNDPSQFRDARDSETQGLLARGTSIVPASEASRHRTYGGRFVDEIKNAGTPQAFEKSRFVVQGFNDCDHGLFTHV